MGRALLQQQTQGELAEIRAWCCAAAGIPAASAPWVTGKVFMYVFSGSPTVYGQDRAAPGGSAGCEFRVWERGLGIHTATWRERVVKELSQRLRELWRTR